MNRFALLVVLSVAAAPLCVFSSGCSSTEAAVEADQPALSLTASRNDILVGETTTIFANTQNLLGRDAQVNWSTTSGRIEPEQNGRLARFTPDQVGSALITAEITMEDGRVLRESRTVQVRGIR